ncbi:DUF927 domain-containing protein [Tissierella sp. Yu-01]|uniref:DUF927 domain-containing protein n=1 Tax=Tissierella sp. Yu-01 TaxID=3035694 RepID=UPI00240DF286|nr:DUF927 domain-containing protein [Tissierella sp. Yu-01]WFA09522.1 DUF927 domain-containing protein [Tissierella sp. Yu-01]
MALKKAKRYELPDTQIDKANEKNLVQTGGNSVSNIGTTIKFPPNRVFGNTEDTSSINIEYINQNIDTDKYTSILRYFFKGKEHKLEVNRSSYLRKNEIIKLQDFGLQVTERNAHDIIKQLEIAERNAPINKVHSKIGFDIYDRNYVFKHSRGVNVYSSYIGKLDISPKGDYGTWYKNLHENVIGNIPLEAMLVVGFSSAIVGLLSILSNKDSLVVHLSGDSTTGKTTASMLAISIWGNPSTKISNGLSTTWNTTENAMFHNIVGNHGLAVLFDEVSMNNSLDFTKFIYKFTGNKDKSRLNKESKLEVAGTWGTVIITNGEFSLLIKSKKNTGAQLRIIDFNNIAWTKDAISADEINQCILENYGHAGTIFVGKLLEMKVDDIHDEIIELKEYTVEQMKEKGVKDKYVERRSLNYAILMYTAYKVSELLSIPLHIEDIWNFLMDNEKESIEGRDLQNKAYTYFLEQVNINHNKFIHSDSMQTSNPIDIKNSGYEIMGKINVLTKENYNEICIFQNYFNELMKNGGFEDSKIILKKWKDEGILDCEADRYTRKRTLIPSMGAVPIYVIRVKKEDFSDKDRSIF